MAAARSISDILSQGFPVPQPPQLNASPGALEKSPPAQVHTETSSTIRELLASIDTAEHMAAMCARNRDKQDSLGLFPTCCSWHDRGKLASLLESAMDAIDSRPGTPHWGAKDSEGESPSTADFVEVASDGSAFDSSDEWSFDDSPRLDCLESMSPAESEKESSFLWQPQSTVAEHLCYEGGHESCKAPLLTQEMAARCKERCDTASPGVVKRYGVIARAVQKIAAARLGVGAHAESYPLAELRCSDASVLSLGESSARVPNHEATEAYFDESTDNLAKVQRAEHCAQGEVEVLLCKSDEFSSAVAVRLQSVLQRLDTIAQSWALDLPTRIDQKEEIGNAVPKDLKKASCPSSSYSENTSRHLCSDEKIDSNKLQCRSGHSLLEASKDNHWMCDVCDRMFISGMQATRHRCAWCDYDVCNACSSQSAPVARLISDYDALAQMSPMSLNNEIAMPLMGCVDDLGKAYAWLDEANSRYLRSSGTYLPEALYNQACCLCLGADAALRCPSKTILGLPPFVPESRETLVEIRLDLAIEKLTTAVAAGYCEVDHMRKDRDLKLLREVRKTQFARLLGTIQT